MHILLCFYEYSTLLYQFLDFNVILLESLTISYFFFYLKVQCIQTVWLISVKPYPDLSLKLLQRMILQLSLIIIFTFITITMTVRSEIPVLRYQIVSNISFSLNVLQVKHMLYINCNMSNIIEITTFC